jgi:hypothetical protein
LRETLELQASTDGSEELNIGSASIKNSRKKTPTGGSLLTTADMDALANCTESRQRWQKYSGLCLPAPSHSGRSLLCTSRHSGTAALFLLFQRVRSMVASGTSTRLQHRYQEGVDYPSLAPTPSIPILISK